MACLSSGALSLKIISDIKAGFPYPENVALSSQLEDIVRTNGGIPATIGVLNGIARVGMQSNEIEELLETAGRQNTLKLSRRDLGYICGVGMNGRKLNGGTTIAATLVLAHLAGIKVFATGGLGGVHRGGEISMDVSADLTELGRTPVALVSSGCKSFLDTARTLEVLETQGVGVATFRDERNGPIDFPAFWTRESGSRSPIVVEDEREAAAIFYAQLNLPLSSGFLFANPIPSEHSLPKSMMDEVMARAVRDAETEGVLGSDNTPFVLSRIRELTQGATVTANRALVKSNVTRGTKVAVELANLEKSQTRSIGYREQVSDLQPSRNGPTSLRSAKIDRRARNHEFTGDNNAIMTHHEQKVDVLVAGCIAMDLSCVYAPIEKSGIVKTRPLLNTSNPARITQSLGGVGQNIATASHYFGASTRLCSVIGNDLAGQSALAILKQRNLSTFGISIDNSGKSTAQYIAVNDTRKDLVIAMADMNILEGYQNAFEMLWEPQLKLCKPRWLVVDANWDSAVLKKWVAAGRKVGARIAYEPVSVEKSTRILSESWKFHLDSILRDHLSQGNHRTNPYGEIADLIAPNEMELLALSKQTHAVDAWSSFLASLPEEALQRHIQSHLDTSLISISLGTAFNALKLLSYFPCVLTKLGSNGVLHAEFLKYGDNRLYSPEAAPYIFCCRQSEQQKKFIEDHIPPIMIPEVDPASSLSGIAGVYLRHFAPAKKVEPEKIVSVNGVGDTFLGVLVAGLAQGFGTTADQLVMQAQRGAVMTLLSEESVSPDLKMLRQEVSKDRNVDIGE